MCSDCLLTFEQADHIDGQFRHANGNMISGAGRTLTYDYDNRPTSIIYNGNAVVSVYDSSGNRTQKMITAPSQNITTYIGQLYDCNAGVCTKYIFAGTQRIAQVKGADTYYYHTDHLGSSSVITDQNGDSVQSIYYYPYGEIHTNSGSDIAKHKFTGHEWDAETGLIYMGARYYDPKLARFISADTIVPMPFYPQTLNRYAYCYNNPIMIRDLDGHAGTGFWSTAWSNTKSAVSRAWGHVKSFAIRSWGHVRSAAGRAWTGVKNAACSVVKALGGGGGSSGNNVYASNDNGTVTDAGRYGSNENGAEAAYGETSGLYPQQKTNGSIYNPKTWDNDSYQNLQDARSYIADVSGRNTYVRSDRPTGNNSFEQKVWNACKVAADNASNLSIPSDVNHFFIRQNGAGRQKPNWAGDSNPYKSFGPFINTGGGDVPKGNQTFIDFYRGIK